MYGQDDRNELRNVGDPALVAFGLQSVVAIIAPTDLGLGAESVEAHAPSFEKRFNLCPDQRFASQPSLAGCTGILVDDDLVLTAGHCFVDDRDCRRYRYVVGLALDADGRLPVIAREDVYACRGLVLHGDPTNDETDYAVVQLDRPVALGRPARGTRRPAEADVGERLVALGYLGGLPMKADPGVRVVSKAPSGFRATVDATAVSLRGHHWCARI